MLTLCYGKENGSMIMSNTFTHHWGGNYSVNVLIQEEYFNTCISHQSRNYAAVNQNSLSIYVGIIILWDLV